jgi:hypothetical protein
MFPRSGRDHFLEGARITAHGRDRSEVLDRGERHDGVRGDSENRKSTFGRAHALGSGAADKWCVHIDGDSLIVEIEGSDKLWALKNRLIIPLANVLGATADPGVINEPPTLV